MSERKKDSGNQGKMDQKHLSKEQSVPSFRSLCIWLKLAFRVMHFILSSFAARYVTVPLQRKWDQRKLGL
jgi:hypothetical protein